MNTRYRFKTILASAVFVGVLGLLFLGIGVVIYGRTGGKELAERLGVPRPAIIAHRGASYLSPEETAPAYLLAREMGADYLELDLQRTKDGVLIALHDDDLRRTTNIAEVFPDRKMDTVDTFTFTELQSLDAGSWFNTRFPDRARASFKNVRILRLEDVMEIAEGGSDKPGLYIETKSARRFPGVEKQLVEILTARGWIKPLARSVSESPSVSNAFTRSNKITLPARRSPTFPVGYSAHAPKRSRPEIGRLPIVLVRHARFPRQRHCADILLHGSTCRDSFAPDDLIVRAQVQHGVLAGLEDDQTIPCSRTEIDPNVRHVLDTIPQKVAFHVAGKRHRIVEIEPHATASNDIVPDEET